MSLNQISDSIRHGSYHHTVPRQSYVADSEAIEANCLQRTANSNETALQRIQRQQAVIGSQLQRIDEFLKRTSNGHTPAVCADSLGRRPVNDDLLQGIGSQFNDVSGPNPKSHGP